MADLGRFLQPRSVAIVGASSNKHKPGGRVVRYLQEYGFAGRIYPVNPAREEIAGLRCYPSLSAIGQPVDTVVITLPAAEVPDVVAEVVRLGAAGAVVYSSGFRELGTPEGELLHNQLVELVRSSGLALIGPNTAGIINVAWKLNLCFSIQFENQAPLQLGGVSLVTQGGGAGGVLFPLSRQVGVNFSHFLNCGNEAGLQVADCIRYLAEDPSTRVIIGYMEGVRDPARFLEATAAAHRSGKPVVILKTGRSQMGARVVASHTGAVAGQHRLTEAFFRKAGVVLVDDVWDLMGAAQLLKDGKVSRGSNLAIVTNSGSLGAMITDLAEDLGFRLVAPLDSTVAALERTLPSYVQAGNPADVANMPALDPHLIGKAVNLLLADAQLDNLIINLVLGIGHNLDVICSEIVRVYQSSDKPVAVVISGSEPKAAELLCAAGVPTYGDTTRALKALAAARLAACVAPYEGPPPGRPVPRPQGSLRTLNEADSAALANRHGIPMARSIVARNPAAAVAAAEAIGFPVAVKILSADIAHKSESDGVRLNLTSGEEVRIAAATVIENAGRAHPDARLDGVLVQEMCPQGIEVVVGATRDPVYGCGIMFGLGGVAMELLNDVAFAVSPLTRAEARDMVRRIRSFPLLNGYRGALPADTEAVVDLILAVDRLMQEQTQLQELDLNPIRVYPAGQGVKVADALGITIE